jgi:pimeloyl-ACP methyl ester carboxylesterase
MLWRRDDARPNEPTSCTSMTLPPIVFSHANGFPAGTYRLLFAAWRSAGHEVFAIERYGHDPRHPVTSNWPHLRDQLVGFLEAQANTPAWLVGHSLGGMVSMLAAAQRPDLARGVVLLDAPVVAGWRAQGVRLAKATGLARRITPGRIARVRRQHWPSREAVHAHFAGKPAFARWDPRVLDDYVAAGFVDEAGRARLAFDREIEARIYETLPHHIGRLLARGALRCPLAYVGGRGSDEARQAGLAATRRWVGERFEVVDGTHLFPMEHPETAAAAVLRMIGRMST